MVLIVGINGTCLVICDSKAHKMLTHESNAALNVPIIPYGDI